MAHSELTIGGILWSFGELPSNGWFINEQFITAIHDRLSLNVTGIDKLIVRCNPN